MSTTPNSTTHPENMTSIVQSSLSISKKRTSAHKQQTHDVYTRRYKHFQTVRLLSFLVGGSILLLLILGMWQLQRMVFSTIEDTEHLFLITEKRRTHIIDFTTLESVRAAWVERNNTPQTVLFNTLFHTPIESEIETFQEI